VLKLSNKRNVILFVYDIVDEFKNISKKALDILYRNYHVENESSLFFLTKELKSFLLFLFKMKCFKGYYSISKNFKF